jgi:hypothetical protein
VRPAGRYQLAEGPCNVSRSATSCTEPYIVRGAARDSSHRGKRTAVWQQILNLVRCSRPWLSHARHIYLLREAQCVRFHMGCRNEDRDHGDEGEHYNDLRDVILDYLLQVNLANLEAHQQSELHVFSSSLS